MNLRRRDGRYLRIGHRGAAGLGAANTLGTIDAALAFGLDGIEIDVVAIGGDLHVAHSLRERTGETPTLEAALARFAGSGPDVFVHLDLKVAGEEERVVRALEEHGLAEQAIVSSYSATTLRAVRRAAPSLPTGLAYPYDRTGLAERLLPERLTRAGLATARRALPRRLGRMVRAANVQVAMLHHLVVTPAVVARCRALGVPVWAWTVNDGQALARVDGLGVDAVITDVPAIFGS